MVDSNSNKNICFYLSELTYGGAEKVVINLANFLVNNNYRVTILTLNNKNDFKEFINSKVELVSLNSINIKNSIIPYYKYLKKNDFDFVFSNIWPINLISAFFKILGLKTNMILIEHCNLSEEFRKKSFFFKFLQNISIYIFYRFADKIISVSRGVQDDLIAKGAPKNKSIVIYNPLFNSSNSNIKNNIEEKKYLNWNKEVCYKIISIGQLKKQKNIPNLIEAIDILNKKNFLKFKLLILGDGEERSDIEFIIKNKNLQDLVTISGWVKNPLKFLQTSDLMVLSSDYEGFGLVILEALSMGINVVSTDCKSGPSEILEHGKYGFLAKVNNPQSLAEKIIDAINYPISKKILKQRSSIFSLEEIGNKYIQILES